MPTNINFFFKDTHRLKVKGGKKRYSIQIVVKRE